MLHLDGNEVILCYQLAPRITAWAVPPLLACCKVTRRIDGVEGGVCVSLLCDICREQQEQGSIWISVPAKWTFTQPSKCSINLSPPAELREERMLLTLPLRGSLQKAARLAPPPRT